MLGYLTAGLFFMLLIWGNLVAGMHAGMACPDWPLCHGELVPPLRLDVWMEFLHRVLAALATLFLLALARRRLRTYQGRRRIIPIAAVTLITLQILLGALVVLLELPVQPTTVHFMVGLAIFILVLYLALCDGDSQPARFSISGYAGPLLYITFLLFLQGSLGAFVRHSAAGLACPDFPTCLGSMIPPLLDGHVVIQFSHRLLAFGTFATVLLLYLVSLVDRRLKERQTDLLAMVSLVAVQIVVGAATVKSGLSYPIASLHLALTLVLVGFSLRIWLLQIASYDGEKR